MFGRREQAIWLWEDFYIYNAYVATSAATRAWETLGEPFVVVQVSSTMVRFAADLEPTGRFTIAPTSEPVPLYVSGLRALSDPTGSRYAQLAGSAFTEALANGRAAASSPRFLAQEDFVRRWQSAVAGVPYHHPTEGFTP